MSSNMPATYEQSTKAIWYKRYTNGRHLYISWIAIKVLGTQG